ncbi:basic blue protein-like [Panicum miliaceum]|uniref:Basic blue protein-like n=1 Tax=Panicum miliaceum TaxID=4540 RepID=A0A3L6PZ78_PANMI|nr:basic blue protein-like [Panicum miliaceum]
MTVPYRHGADPVKTKEPTHWFGRRQHLDVALLFRRRFGVLDGNTLVHEPGQYSTCDIPDNATIWTSGDNRITIPRGMSFFICGIRDHCKNGLKIAVTAS